MGRADGLLVGGSLLSGVLLGPRAILLAPTVYVLVQLLVGRVDVPRIVLCCLFAGIGSLRTPDGPAVFAFDTAVLSSTSAIGQVRSMPESVDGGQRFLLDVDVVLVADEWQVTRFTALLTLRGGDSNVGDKLWVAWSLAPPENLPPEYLAYVHSQGADTTAVAFTGDVRERGESWRRPFVELRQTLSDTLRTAAPDDSGALLAGLATGDDSRLGERASAAFLDTGTTHITAVSGSNLALVAGVWSALGSASGWRRRWWLGAAIVASVWVYAAVVGFQPPAMRAAVVVSLTAFAIRVGRRADPLTLVLLAAGAMAMVDPHRS